MKISAAVVAGLLVSTCESFTIPQSTAGSKTGFGSSSLAFAPKGVSTAEKSTSEFNPFKIDSELGVSTLTTPDKSKKDVGEVWERFANWVTSTENRLYIGWFGTLMVSKSEWKLEALLDCFAWIDLTSHQFSFPFEHQIPTILTAASCFVAAMIAAPPGKCTLLKISSFPSKPICLPQYCNMHYSLFS